MICMFLVSFQLSTMRFATVSEFRGRVMVGIREYYDAGGELKPGKKGNDTILTSVSPAQKFTSMNKF